MISAKRRQAAALQRLGPALNSLVTNIMYISMARRPMDWGIIYTFTLCLSVKADPIPGRVGRRGRSLLEGVIVRRQPSWYIDALQQSRVIIRTGLGTPWSGDIQGLESLQLAAGDFRPLMCTNAAKTY